ncbi:Uncharacterized protein FWK35_00024595 [Aphis craccivora]|uniref:Uncharacterized protein n=1 Tax=Aphis craccivora TaxID=307492 RepID=A0A6G0YE65_APHCR|nr:Uncharacterized protein FWK35_00024595 [Aphis craccivora]
MTNQIGFFVLCIIIITILLYKEDTLMIADKTLAKSCKPIVIIFLLFLLCLILYFNNKLKRATFVVIRNINIPINFKYIMEIYQIHIVRRFYNNELEHLATSNCNIDETMFYNSTPIQMKEISVKYTHYKCITMPF